MDSSWFLPVLSAAVFVSMALLTIVCLSCWNKGPLVSIRQTHASEEYMPSTEFRVVHSLQSPTDLNSIRSGHHLLSPPRLVSSSVDSGTQRRHRSFTPTETESNPSYENPAEGPEYLNSDLNLNLADSDAEDPGYIIVIPDGEALSPSNQSRVSTPSSDVRHEYVNLEAEKQGEGAEQEEEEEEEQYYLNVDPQDSQTAQSDSDDDDDDDDDGGNYVNQPPMTHSHLRA